MTNVNFEYSGKMTKSALLIADEIAEKSNSSEEAWDLANKSEACDEINENGFFIEN